ncbi:MAG: phosphatidylserine decarboxylase family protein [Bacteroidales bacterium]|jgi:phosphatidylserine decarboxylase|nr:phosphatidylserine decarboxylase family protein [Bacteroidales bacterium]
MKLHKEGFATLIVAFILLFGLTVGVIFVLPSILWLKAIIIVFALFIYYRIAYFFRVPKREYIPLEGSILSSADGEIVAIEEVFEDEYLKQKCIQVSVFMSPSNVHVNWMPASGLITYYKYHQGKHLVAYHPKSSNLNERTSLGLRLRNDQEILIRQIAGLLARRIVCYASVRQTMNQTEEFGFIKFGSRVDLFLPLETEIIVRLKDKVIGGQTVLANLI